MLLQINIFFSIKDSKIQTQTINISRPFQTCVILIIMSEIQTVFIFLLESAPCIRINTIVLKGLKAQTTVKMGNF